MPGVLRGIREISNYLKVCQATARKWIDTRALPVQRVGKMYCATSTALDAWVSKSTPTSINLYSKDITPLDQIYDILIMTGLDLFFDVQPLTGKLLLKPGLKVGKDFKLDHLIKLMDMRESHGRWLDGKGNSSGKEGVDNALWEIFGENKDKAEEQNQGQGEVGKETGKEANKTTSQENNSGASVRLRKPKESFREDDEKENQEVEYTPPETSTPSIFATINPGRIHIGYPDEPPNGTTRKEDTD